MTLLILLVVFVSQISDFYQRRMIQSSSSVDPDRSKDCVKPDSEQELEVRWPRRHLPGSGAILLV